MTKEFDKRNMAKSRRVCEDMEAAHVTKWLKLTERERQILAMWPRFEDDEYVWFGDAYIDTGGDANKVRAIEFDEGCTDLVGIEGFHTGFFAGERVKRPAPKDSWERLEEDAAKSDCDYFGRDVSDCDRCPARESTLSCGQSKSLDIIRRAKALAGVEVDE